MVMDELFERVNRLEVQLNNLFKQGIVTEVGAEKGTVKVMLPDSGGIISKDLPILFKRTRDNQDYDMPSIDEQVFCVFLPNGHEQGFVLGSSYSSVDKVPVTDGNQKHYEFKDGSSINYDFEKSKLTGKFAGNSEISIKKDEELKVGNNFTLKIENIGNLSAAKEVEIMSPKILLKGNISTTSSTGGQSNEEKNTNTKQTGDFTLNGNLIVNGNITATGSVMDSGGNSNHHSH